MKSQLFCCLVALTFAYLHGACEAAISFQNPGFETGDYSGWTVLERIDSSGGTGAISVQPFAFPGRASSLAARASYFPSGPGNSGSRGIDVVQTFFFPTSRTIRVTARVAAENLGGRGEYSFSAIYDGSIFGPIQPGMKPQTAGVFMALANLGIVGERTVSAGTHEIGLRWYASNSDGSGLIGDGGTAWVDDATIEFLDAPEPSGALLGMIAALFVASGRRLFARRWRPAHCKVPIACAFSISSRDSRRSPGCGRY